MRQSKGDRSLSNTPPRELWAGQQRRGCVPGGRAWGPFLKGEDARAMMTYGILPFLVTVPGHK